MPRRPRGLIVNAFAHVTAKGNRGTAIYPRRGDYEFFLTCLRAAAAAYAVRVHAYCLMPNHFHLLLEATDRPLSPFMQVLLQRHAQYVNRVYRHRGHVFADRFWSRICRDDLDLLASLRYIHLNPVKAELATHPAQYPWSSHRVYLGRVAAPWVVTAILNLFGADRTTAVGVYARFIEFDPEVRSRNRGGQRDGTQTSKA